VGFDLVSHFIFAARVLAAIVDVVMRVSFEIPLATVSKLRITSHSLMLYSVFEIERVKFKYQKYQL